MPSLSMPDDTRTIFQNTVEPAEEYGNSDHSCNNIAEGLCQEYRHDLILQKQGQNEDQRNQQNQFSQASQQQTDLRLSQRHKSLLTGELEAQREDACHVNTHRPGCVTDQGSIVIEDTDKDLGHQHGRRPETGRIASSEGEDDFKALLHTIGIAGAEIEADDRKAPLYQTLGGHGNQLRTGGDDGHSANGQVSAKFRKAGIEADTEDAFRCHHYKGGNAQA